MLDKHSTWQLHSLIFVSLAVFNSWYSPRAIKYRDINEVPSNLGTGVVVQSMVYGNMNDDSGSGVGFTRDPTTGKNIIYGEYLRNAEVQNIIALIDYCHNGALLLYTGRGRCVGSAHSDDIG